MHRTPSVATGALLVVVWSALLEFNFVHLSPIVGGYACKNDEFQFAVSLQLPNGTISRSQQPHHQQPIDPTNGTAATDVVATVRWTHVCGGTYLRNGWILTASHCVAHLKEKNSGMIAVIGERDLQQRRKPWRNYKVDDIKSQKYDPFTYSNDIAMVKIDLSQYGEPFDEKYQVKIPKEPLAKNSKSNKDDVCYLCGYGSNEYNGEPMNKLMMGPNSRISQHDCENKLGKYMAPEIGSTMFCAEGKGPNGQVDACQGDSGGALLCKIVDHYEPVGIVSYGAGCGAVNSPGVYTSTADHRPWILKYLDGDEQCENV